MKRILRGLAIVLMSATVAHAAPLDLDPSASPALEPVTRTRATQIEFDITPADVEIFLDGRSLGKASDVDLVRTRPGRRLVRLTRNGDATELELDVKRGQTLRLAYDLSD